MNNLFILLIAIFGGVALMVVLGERYAKPMDEERQAQLSRWIWPLLLIGAALGALQYYLA